MARTVMVEGAHPRVSGATVVLVCDGIADFHRYLKSVENDRRARKYVRCARDEWSGNRTWNEAMTALLTGDVANVAAAVAMERECEGLLDWSARKFVTVNSVAGGGALNVGAWLAGQPDIVRLRKRVEDDKAPLTVVVANNSASGVSHKALVRRGMAILALVRLLSATRAVTLWSVAASPMAGPLNSGMAVKIETAPLVLGHAAYILSDPSFARILGFAARETCHKDLRGAKSFPAFGGSSAAAKEIGGAIMASALNVPVADTLYIPRAGESDDGGLTDNPVKWLSDMLVAYGRSGQSKEEN